MRVRLAEVDRLVAQARDAGLSVRLEMTGEVRPLPVNVDLVGYRIVQESLTNALKHGSGQAALTVGYARNGSASPSRTRSPSVMVPGAAGCPARAPA